MPGTAIEISATSENLLAAFEYEINTRSQYDVYAARVHTEGLYRGVVSLFRAVARAEEIHAANHVLALKKSGGTIKCEFKSFPAGTTLEQLKIALDCERHEIETLYPKFLEDAEADKNAQAIRTFRYALQAEKSHVQLFSRAIELVESSPTDPWIANAHSFYVCPGCGFVSETRDRNQECPVCAGLQRWFEKIPRDLVNLQTR